MADWELAHRLFQFVAVASRPLRVEELAEFLAFDFDAGPTPRFNEGWRLEDPINAVQSTCPGFLVVVDIGGSQIIQFSHFSVKEFLTSSRLAEAKQEISRYHVSMTPAHTIVAKACLGILLHLDKTVAKDALQKFPLASYAALHLVDHARFDGVSQNVEDGMNILLDSSKPHLAIWVSLHNAESESGQADVARRPLEPGADATAQDNDGSIPLSEPSESGHASPAQLRVPGSPGSAAQDKDRWSPLHRVSDRDQFDGADTTARDMEESTPQNPDLVESEGGHGKPEQSFEGHGADVAAQDLDGSTQLHLASQAGNIDLARSLVEHGADTRVQDKDGVTPLHWVYRSGHVDLAQLLIDHGADVVAQDNDGSTPLHWASESRHVEFAQLLVEHGANVTAEDKDRSTPLHWASRTGHIDLARFLVEQGADATAQDKDGFTPLQLASQSGHVMLTRFLEGVVVTTQDKDGSTPLHHASQDGHLERTLVLLGEGAGADSRDENGVTPVHLASRFGHLEIVRALLTHGAYASPRDESGWTPLHFASEEGRLDIVRLLLDHGGDNGTLP